MKTLFLSVTLLVILILSSCTKDDTSLSAMHTTSDHELEKLLYTPFNETPRAFKGTINSVPAPPEAACDCEEDDLVLATKGSGELTHMGLVTTFTTACVEGFIFDDDGNTIGSNINSVCSRYVAANGDVLNLYTGPHQNLFDPSCLCVASEITTYFTGGNGRFANATGSAHVSLSIDVFADPLFYTSVFDGEISY